MNVWDGTSSTRDTGSQRAPDRVDWDENVKQVADTQTAVNVNAASVVSSDANISTNTGNIATNVSGIANNVTDIGTNVTDIANALAGINANATHSVGAVTSKSGLTVAELGDGALHKTILTLAGVAMTSTDATTNGAQANQELYTFPEGHIVILGAHAVFDTGGIVATTGGGTGYSDTADLGIGVGTVAANAGVGLDGTEEDICAEMDVDLVAKASNAEAAIAQATAAMYDGSGTPIKAILNTSTLDDADHGATGDTLTVTGTITILWSTLGDDA